MDSDQLQGSEEKTHRVRILARVGVALVLAAATLGAGACADRDTLRIASGTIIIDTGFADDLARLYLETGGDRIDIQGVGSGEAFALARRGEVDALLVHEPDGLAALRTDGLVVEARPVFRSRWVIVGPAQDPAGVSRASSIADAFARIAARRSRFVSRGDGSGTHAREIDAWAAAGIEPDRAWYGETGQGQSDTLRIADERGAYALTDLATYTTIEQTVDLSMWAIHDSDIWTTYEAVALRGPSSDRARRFVAFTGSDDVRRLVRGFGANTFGRPLFTTP